MLSGLPYVDIRPAFTNARRPLKNAGCDEVYTDIASGVSWEMMIFCKLEKEYHGYSFN